MCMYSTTKESRYCPLACNKVFKVLDDKPMEHKGQKRKLLLTEDGTVYKVKRTKLENTINPGQYVLRTVYLCK